MIVAKFAAIASLAVSFAFEIYVLLSIRNRTRAEEKEFRNKVEWFSSLSDQEQNQYEQLCCSYQRFVSEKDGGNRSDD
jgi:hypothetical protein